MIPVSCSSTISIPPPAYQRAHRKAQPALHLDALTLVTQLHLLALCRLAVCLAHWWCPSPLPAGPGGYPRVYTEESLLLIALLRTLWRLSYQDRRDWLYSWSALAVACGLPRGPLGQPRIPWSLAAVEARASCGCSSRGSLADRGGAGCPPASAYRRP
jgi:hypothetical protein